VNRRVTEVSFYEPVVLFTWLDSCMLSIICWYTLLSWILVGAGPLLSSARAPPQLPAGASPVPGRRRRSGRGPG
jgi:hypothetical protein